MPVMRQMKRRKPLCERQHIHPPEAAVSQESEANIFTSKAERSGILGEDVKLSLRPGEVRLRRVK